MSSPYSYKLTSSFLPELTSKKRISSPVVPASVLLCCVVSGAQRTSLDQSLTKESDAEAARSQKHDDSAPMTWMEHGMNTGEVVCGRQTVKPGQESSHSFNTLDASRDTTGSENHWHLIVFSIQGKLHWVESLC